MLYDVVLLRINRLVTTSNRPEQFNYYQPAITGSKGINYYVISFLLTCIFFMILYHNNNNNNDNNNKHLYSAVVDYFFIALISTIIVDISAMRKRYEEVVDYYEEVRFKSGSEHLVETCSLESRRPDHMCQNRSNTVSNLSLLFFFGGATRSLVLLLRN